MGKKNLNVRSMLSSITRSPISLNITISCCTSDEYRDTQCDKVKMSNICFKLWEICTIFIGLICTYLFFWNIIIGHYAFLKMD